MIEFAFSIIKYKGEEQRILRTKGEKVAYKKDTYQTFSFEDDNLKIIYKCKIGDLIKQDKDQDNNYYSWFLVTDYSETIDKSPKYDRELERQNADIDFLLMINGIDPQEEEDNEQNVL